MANATCHHNLHRPDPYLNEFFAFAFACICQRDAQAARKLWKWPSRLWWDGGRIIFYWPTTGTTNWSTNWSDNDFLSGGTKKICAMNFYNFLINPPQAGMSQELPFGVDVWWMSGWSQIMPPICSCFRSACFSDDENLALALLAWPHKYFPEVLFVCQTGRWERPKYCPSFPCWWPARHAHCTSPLKILWPNDEMSVQEDKLISQLVPVQFKSFRILSPSIGVGPRGPKLADQQ